MNDAAEGFGSRAAVRVIQAGAVAVGLAATSWLAFDLDRFFVPKELVLHVTAFLAALFVFRRAAVKTVLFDVFLLLSALSALFATNRWLGFRGLAISVSGVLLFRAGVALQPRALSVARGIALATAAIATASLLQAYGLRIIFFSLNRAPGGTLGNRNFVAHAAAFGLPICVYVFLRGTRSGLIAIALVSAALVLTRSRAAWLATGAMLVVFFGMLIAAGALRDAAIRKRLLLAIVIAGAAVGAALILPNTLRWRSENPYLESLRGMTKYERGSGRGRLVQYERSLRLALAHPLFGAGPGNWAVDYPRFAARDDPSLDSNDAGMTTNPWPSSDWIAFLSERGLAATVVLALALLAIARAAVRVPSLESAVLLGTLAAAVVAGMFDALLLLPAPTLLIWPILGALLPAAESPRHAWSGVITAVMLLVAAAGAARSAAQLVSMRAYVIGADRATLERAAHIDPSNYRLHMRLAHSGRRSERCAHAVMAHALFPNSDAAREVFRPCETRK